jgi:DNA adenine methylase
MNETSARRLHDDDESHIPCRPFLKWVGGKGQLLPELLRRIPKNIDRYFEPFVGGGALLFGYQPAKAFISDRSAELINAYTVVRDSVDILIEDLKKHRYDEQYYYTVRNIDRGPEYELLTPVERASRLIFLNKTCYNGLYRVNAKGHFNTPFGRYTNPKIVDEENLYNCSKMLRNVEISLSEFDSIESAVKQQDFVYFDPPYVPLSATSSFTGYQQGGFDLEMQERLAALCRRLDARGIRFMLSNSSAPLVHKLYEGFHIGRVSAVRAINSKAEKRGAIEELIVTNYPS